MSDFAALDVPGPTITELSAPFWNAAAQGRLLLQVCTACRRAVFYPRPICPHCWQDGLRWREASGRGRLRSFSRIWKPGHPGWRSMAPYYVGLVELVEGPTMLSHILSKGHDLRVGDVMTLAPTAAGGRVLPFFEVLSGQGAESDDG